MANELHKTARRWSKDEPVRDGAGFYLSPLMRPYIIETAYGKELVAEHRHNSYYAVDIFAAEYLKGEKAQTLLSLCCGFGSVERRFVSQLPDVSKCLGVDVAARALEVAKRRAAEEGMDCISYECADLNDYRWQDWEEGACDLVIANGALHHLRNLEGVLAGVRRVLRPGGILYACEYVGPSYQSHSARQLQIINAAAFVVPPELRSRRGLPCLGPKRVFRFVSGLYSAAARQDGPEWPRWKKIVARMLRALLRPSRGDLDFGVVHVSPEDMLRRTDPSECVRSSEIIPLVRDHFPDVEVRPFGGGILQHALDDAFYARFDPANPLHTKSLEMLCRLERHFMDTGEIGIENAFIIARR